MKQIGRLLASAILLAMLAMPAQGLVSTVAAASTTSGGIAVAMPPADATIASNVETLCGPAAPGYARCLALERNDTAMPGVAGQPNSTPSGYGPADIQSAYALPGGSAGAGQTIAIVDAYDLPTAEADLGTYRAQYGLPDCTTANGCFQKVDQNGGATYPAYNAGWADEIALDIEIASAACPNCHILLVEAADASLANLGTAVNEAISLGAKIVSCSWAAAESSANGTLDTAYFKHSGVAIVASTGDDGYDASWQGSSLVQSVGYPAASQYVVSVGGTSLTKIAGGRGWAETAWGDVPHSMGAGSGCSQYEAKPSWQSDAGCANRMQADVSAVADPYTGVATVRTVGATSTWSIAGGTSVSAPIIAGVFGLAGGPAAGVYPASYLYAHPSGFNDVTTGTNDVGRYHCSGTYYCMAGTGYDGPTGLGSPNSIAAFTGVAATSAPDKPLSVAATAGDGSATVSWSQPASNGGAAITAYTVTSSGSQTCSWATGPLTCTVTGLTNGTPYTFTVTATNSVGTGPASDPSGSVTPQATPRPGAPTNVQVFGSNRAVQVTWAAAPPNGPAITAYTATANPGGFHCNTTGALACTITGLTNGTTYQVTVVATNSVGDGPASSPAVSITPKAGATFVPLSPTRILDTRDGTGGLSGPFGNRSARTFTVIGQAGIPSSATAVTGNLTVTQQGGNGYLYIGPVAVNNPTSSNLNFPMGDDRANAVYVALGAGGTLSITYASPVTSSTAHVIFDVTGYFVPDMSGATFVPLTPARILDTRDGTGGLGGPFASRLARSFAVWGHGGVPGTATAVTGTLTVSQQTSLGYLYVGPVAMNNPTSSNLNFPLGDDRANAVTVILGAGGSLSITYASSTPGATAHVIFDVTGYFVPGSGGATYVPLVPARILDSRDGTGGLPGPWTNRAPRTFPVVGRGGVDAAASAVTGNLTVTQQGGGGYLYLGPNSIANPTSSTLNFPVGDDRANAAVVALDGGNLSVTYATPVGGATAHVIFDVSGYFLP